MKQSFLILFLLSLTFSIGTVYGTERDEKQRGFTFDLGMGWQPIIKYPYKLQSVLDKLAGLPGVSEVMININLAAGYYIGSVTNQSISDPTHYYFTVGVDGFARRLEDNTGSIQINNYVYGLGFSSITGHLFSRLAVGSAYAVAQYDSYGTKTSSTSKAGIGLSSRFGWDFNADSGLGLGLGMNSFMAYIESEFVSSIGLSLSVLYY